MFTLLQNGETSSDCTASYSVFLRKGCTVKEFIDCVLLTRDYDYGNIYIGHEIFSYKYGKLISDISEDVLSKTIKEVSAHGGWTLMNYWIILKSEGNKKMATAKIIAGFPGVGKSMAHKYLLHEREYVVLDSDSSGFSKSEDFPANYISHIKENIASANFIFVSTHEKVRKALEENNIKYTLVYPERNCKLEYLERYRDRGSNENFINLLDSKWDEWISDMEKETFPDKITLAKGEFLNNILDRG